MKSDQAKAITGLRDAYLRLKFLLCLNELDDDQEWIAASLKTAARKMARMLRVLEPTRQLPNVRDDTHLGRSIKAAEKERRRQARCKHELQSCAPDEACWTPPGMRCEHCPKCCMTQWVPLQDHRKRKKQLQK